MMMKPELAVFSLVTRFSCVSQRTDEEAVVDRGGTRSMLNTNFEKEELEGKSQGSRFKNFICSPLMLDWHAYERLC